MSGKSQFATLFFWERFSGWNDAKYFRLDMSKGFHFRWLRICYILYMTYMFSPIRSTHRGTSANEINLLWCNASIDYNSSTVEKYFPKKYEKMVRRKSSELDLRSLDPKSKKQNACNYGEFESQQQKYSDMYIFWFRQVFKLIFQGSKNIWTLFWKPT